MAHPFGNYGLNYINTRKACANPSYILVMTDSVSNYHLSNTDIVLSHYLREERKITSTTTILHVEDAPSHPSGNDMPE